MEFSQIFSVLSVLGALLFFSAGFSFGLLKSGKAHERAGAVLEQDWAARESVLRETAMRESEARETALRESEAREAALRESAARQRAAEAVAHERAAEIARLKAAVAELEQRAAKDPVSLPLAQLDATTGATTFQGILGRLGKTKGLRAAVLGDALGLPIASLGDHSDSLAGFCGFISQAASKARDFLQLGSIRRVIIEDERMATLTACSVTGSDIFLATLTSGPGPDFARMVQVLNEVKSFTSQRSRA